jgi:hypothetical protein
LAKNAQWPAVAGSDNVADFANAGSCAANALATVAISCRQRSSAAVADSFTGSANTDSDILAGSDSADFEFAIFADSANADSTACVTAREIARQSSS